MKFPPNSKTHINLKKDNGNETLKEAAPTKSLGLKIYTNLNW
jgi:hypothetical protein